MSFLNHVFLNRVMSHSDKDNRNTEPSSHKENLVEDKARLDDPHLQSIHFQLLREKAEPQEKMTPVPLVLIFMIGVLLFWGGFYISKYSGNFREDVFDHNWVPGEVVQVEDVFDPLVQGKKLFARTCQQCHQSDGQGIPGVYPALADSSWLLSSDVRPVKILLMGMGGPVTVQGKEFNGNMPAVGQWKDRDIAAVLTYVRQEWGNNADPISENLVTTVRDALSDRSNPWSGRELLEIHPL